MKIRHKSVLLKEVPMILNVNNIVSPNGVDHIEVAFKSECEETSDIHIGDKVIYTQAEGKVKVGEEEYILVTEENIKVIL